MTSRSFITNKNYIILYSKLRARTHWTNFCIFCENSVTSSLRQPRQVIFRYTKFCQGLPNFKGAVVLPWSRTNFFRSEIWPTCQFTCDDMKENVNQENLISFFYSKFLSPKPAKIISYLCGNQTVKMKDSFHGIGSLLRVQLLRFPSLRSSCISRAKYSAPAMEFISVWLTLLVNKYFAVAQCAHAWQIEKFGRDKFCQSSAAEP